MNDHKTTYDNVLDQFEMYYFIRFDECRQHKQDNDINNNKQNNVLNQL